MDAGAKEFLQAAAIFLPARLSLSLTLLAALFGSFSRAAPASLCNTPTTYPVTGGYVFVQGLTAFALTALLLLMLAPVARFVGLVDKPSGRKQHQGEIPLIGGLAIFLSLLTLALWWSEPDATMGWYLAACGLLVLSGVLDDRFNITVTIRIVIEVIAALMMIFGAGLWVGDLGNLLGFRDLHMPLWLSAPFTIIAVFGITNAWNMIDGMDGLVGVVTLVALGSFYFITHGAASNNLIPVLLMGGTAAYLVFNLGSNRLLPKVFLGDAGSKLIGFSLVWLLIDSTQGGSFTGMRLPAVLALFVVGLPLIDMVATTVRRMRKGKGPFEPDRTHVHHILLSAGLSQQEALLLIAVLAVQLNFIGIVMYMLKWAAWIQFGVFWLVTALYFATVEHAWRFGRWLQHQSDHDRHS